MAAEIGGKSTARTGGDVRDGKRMLLTICADGMPPEKKRLAALLSSGSSASHWQLHTVIFMPSSATCEFSNSFFASSRTGAGLEYLPERWVSSRRAALAFFATFAAASAVQCLDSFASSARSEQKVASWMRRSAPFAAFATVAHAVASPL